uniref:Tissue inhibitor of metalloprotease n=1 Tax=Ancylostoma duodenale TaxID=51022 RepID=A4ZY77_9BILA|nr:tissue inhibitor of metalloprotease [Ancylostoma duodenale]
MRTAIVLLAFFATASTNLYCPNADKITRKDVKSSEFVALVKVESSVAKGDRYNEYFEYGVKYEKLFQWWHYWVAEATIIRDAPKTLKVSQNCGVRLELGKGYVLGCRTFSHCHFVRPYNNLTTEEMELIQKQ